MPTAYRLLPTRLLPESLASTQRLPSQLATVYTDLELDCKFTDLAPLNPPILGDFEL